MEELVYLVAMPLRKRSLNKEHFGGSLYSLPSVTKVNLSLLFVKIILEN